MKRPKLKAQRDPWTVWRSGFRLLPCCDSKSGDDFHRSLIKRKKSWIVEVVNF